MPRRGRITITIGQAVTPEVLAEGKTEDNRTVAVKLKAAAHQHILRYCGEADLSQQTSY
ncbi:MAG: hypothetical protein BMS9Abin31_0054 [Gammaproteobacteria bacterium]|nr:MAG: hypothetical protein BMS9Abin31_0054 [Gammaproteobacteria bacterium]